MSFPACSLRELSGKGTIKRHLTTSRMLQSDQAAGFQSFFKVFTHISPFYETLGWKIFVIKNPKTLLKITFGRVNWKIFLNCEFATENSTLVGSTNWSLNFSLNVSDVGFINYHFDAYLDRSKPTIWAFFMTLLNLLGDTYNDLLIHFC